MRRSPAAVLLVAFVACAPRPDDGEIAPLPAGAVDDGAHDVDDATTPDAGITTPDAGAASDADGGPMSEDAGTVVVEDRCALDMATICTAWNVRRACIATPAGTRVVDEACADGSGCVAGACVVQACSDECGLGEIDGDAVCALYDVGGGGWIDAAPATSMHDRARAYDARLWRDAYRYTGIGHARYADPGTYEEVAELTGLGDSALHTGEVVAGEALRLATTGAPDARARVRTGIEGLHVLMNVTGTPGVLARHAVPVDAPDAALMPMDCAHPSHHCDVPYDGQLWNYRGHVSRDMYQGVMLAFGLAYDALGDEDEDLRALIREDVVVLVEELMIERSALLKLVYEGTELPAMTVTMPFTLLLPDELDEDGAIVLKYGDDEGSWRGFQEFVPDLADVTDQIMGPFSPPTIPRDGSAIMLTSFFRLALHVTDGVASYASRRAAIEDFFFHHQGRGGNVYDWIDVADRYAPGGEGDDGCGRRYYANNLSMQPLYNWARLETEPDLRSFAISLLEDRAGPAFAPTKNVFFVFLSEGLATTPNDVEAANAAQQLAGFGPPPRVRVAIDLTNDPRYPARDDQCPEQLAHDQAVDVADRGADEFIWQGHPWNLSAPEDLAQTHAGGDYLVAYWLGRHHGFIGDDRPSTCTRWRE